MLFRSDDIDFELLAKQVKQRKDSFEQFTKHGRDELAKIEADELVELEQYMPKQLSDDELAAAVDKAIGDLGASGLQDMGKVMGAVLAAYKGQVDGKKASDMVKTKLS